MAGMISTPPAEQQLGQLAASCRPVTGHPRPRSPSLNSYIACGVTRLLAYSLAAQLNAGPVRRRGTEGGPLLPRILANWITGVSWCAGAAPTPGLSRWSARSAARTNDLDGLPRDTGGRERLTSPLLESSKQGTAGRQARRGRWTLPTRRAPRPCPRTGAASSRRIWTLRKAVIGLPGGSSAPTATEHSPPGWAGTWPYRPSSGPSARNGPGPAPG